MSIPKVMSIAGSDPSGGAGIQADIRTITSLGGYAMGVIAALTAQNPTAVIGICPVDGEFVAKQIDAVFAKDIATAIKTGMLGDGQVVSVVAERLLFYGVKRLVVDPVLVSTSGSALLSADGLEAMKRKLIPLALVVTPNIPEAESLSGIEITSPMEAREALRVIYSLGTGNVILTGGHWKGEEMLDILYDGRDFMEFSGKRIDVKNTHGTGCVFSSALACRLAFGDDVVTAVATAKSFVRTMLLHRLSFGD